MNDESMKLLVANIIRQALFDYRRAIYLHRYGAAEKIIQFFRTDWGIDLTEYLHLSPDAVIETLERMKKEAVR